MSIWSPSTQSTELPSGAPEKDKDSLLASAELAIEAVSSILQDSDLKRADAVSVKEALALSLQGATTVCPNAFICSSYR